MDRKDLPSDAGTRVIAGTVKAAAIALSAALAIGCSGPPADRRVAIGADPSVRSKIWEKETDILKTAQALDGQFVYQPGENDFVRWIVKGDIDPLSRSLMTLQSDNFIYYVLRSSKQQGFDTDARLSANVRQGHALDGGAHGLYRLLNENFGYQKVKDPQNGDIVFLSERRDPESKGGTIWLHEGIFDKNGLWHLGSEAGKVKWDALPYHRFDVQGFLRRK